MLLDSLVETFFSQRLGAPTLMNPLIRVAPHSLFDDLCKSQDELPNIFLLIAVRSIVSGAPNEIM